MAGRRPAVDPSLIIDAVLKFKDQVIDPNQNKKAGVMDVYLHLREVQEIITELNNKMMFSVYVKYQYFLKNFKFIPKYKIYYSTVSYVQGQSPEKKIREYFYYIDHQGMLFLDDSKMKNFTSAYKETDFLVFFFKRLKPNTIDRYREHFPWISLCGRERNFIRCDDFPIVFTQIIQGEDGNFLFCHNHAGPKLTVLFQPNKLWMDVENGRVYHPANEQHGSIGLVSSRLAIELSKMFIYDTDKDNYVPTHFMWCDEKYTLDPDWFQNLIDK